MPWFKIDDSSHSHPKFLRAGNAALGLWLRCGAYSAQHLTEGIVPGIVAANYGTAPQAAKLVKTGLWHTAGHTCPRCPQPLEADDYVIHDFFEGGRNSTRAQVESAKRAAADRSARARSGRKSAPNPGGNADDPEPKTDPNESETAPETNPFDPQFPHSAAGGGGLSHRDDVEGGTHPLSSSSSYPRTSYGGTSSPQPPADQLPAVAFRTAGGGGETTPVQELVDAMGARQMTVSWALAAEEWTQLAAQVEQMGTAALAEHAARVWQAAKTKPYSARYFLPGWLALRPAPEHHRHPAAQALGGPSAALDYLADMADIANGYSTRESS